MPFVFFFALSLSRRRLTTRKKKLEKTKPKKQQTFLPKNVPLGQLLAARASGLPSATALLSHQKQGSAAVDAHRAAKRLAKEAKRKARKEEEHAERDAAASAGNKNADAEEKEARRLRRRNRENKNRPTEAPSNRQPPKLREVIAPVVPRAREARDPRFDPLVVGDGGGGGGATTTSGSNNNKRKRVAAAAAAAAGAFGHAAAASLASADSARALKRYSFLFDETLPAERDSLVAQLKKTKSQSARAQLQSRLTQVTQALRAEESRRAAERAMGERRQRERSAVAAGKRPYYPKASQLRKEALAAKFEELKKSGKLAQALEKRRKKNAAKDHRYMPSGRRGDEGDEIGGGNAPFGGRSGGGGGGRGGGGGSGGRGGFGRGGGFGGRGGGGKASFGFGAGRGGPSTPSISLPQRRVFE